LTSVLDGGEWSTSFPSHLSSRSGPRTHQTGGWVGPRAGLGILEKRKTSCSCQDSNPLSSSLQPSYYTEHAILVPISMTGTASLTE